MGRILLLDQVLLHAEGLEAGFTVHDLAFDAVNVAFVAREIDLEVRRLVMTAMNEARECLKLHRDELEKLAQALLERETLSIDEINVLLGFTPEATAHDDVPGEAKEIRPTTDAGSVGNSL